MKIHDVEQLSPAWVQLHVGRLTASQFDDLISPVKFEAKEGKAHKTLVARKLAEWWRDRMDDDLFTSLQTENGLIREPNAIGKFELATGLQVKRVGFMESDCGNYGCSPDGLIVGINAGLEVKCPTPAVHVKYLLAGGVPLEYRPQVFGSLYLSGFEQWYFYSYCVGFPELIVKVEPEEEKTDAIKEALEQFSLDFEAGKRYLIDLNGGEPKRKTEKLSTERPKFSWELRPNDMEEVTP